MKEAALCGPFPRGSGHATHDRLGEAVYFFCRLFDASGARSLAKDTVEKFGVDIAISFS